VAQQEKGLEELRGSWGWLDGAAPEDRPWLHFAAHRAFHQLVLDCPLPGVSMLTSIRSSMQ
jgi:hypothetical protein